MGLNGPEVPIRDVVVELADYPNVTVRLHYPPGVDPLNASGANLPVVLSFFGGGFRHGGFDAPGFREAYKFRAAEAGVIIAAVGYALAPEHPWPAAAEQGYAALDWVFQHAEEIGARPDRIAVAGASSGGNLAVVSTLINQDRAQHPVAAQVLEVPALDLSRGHLDFSMLDELNMDSEAVGQNLLKLVEDYIPDAASRTHRYASPLLVEDLSGLPPAYIFTAEYDPLRADGEAYAGRLSQAGVATYCVRNIGQTHTSGGNLGVSPAARVASDVIIGIFKKLHD
ncbi:hypothetical protein UM93_02700 [Psychromicrobium lacuslunae]|uniref:Alpha/beta hydrolase fold-3 domain-containing protein n=1 Tax=Psychromicrobium lacuslunae TaxID=1618207 RepID=A0A0D4C2Q5_9MICC|nr:hypothetical protein UM93_02700 [Psychromicrobium lacuslunae]